MFSFRLFQPFVGEDSSCSICLSQFEDAEDAKILPCNHMFHTLCIHAWLSKVSADDILNFISNSLFIARVFCK